MCFSICMMLITFLVFADNNDKDYSVIIKSFTENGSYVEYPQVSGLKDKRKQEKEYRINRFENKRAYLSQYSSRLSSTFQSKLNVLINEQVNKQKNKDNADRIKLIYLCQLLSSSYTGSYEVILGMSNSKLYLDEKKSQVYWYPESIYESIDKDMEEIEKILRKKFIRLQDSELFYIKQKLLYDDWKLLKKVFYFMSIQSVGLILDSPLRKENELLFLCGNYMDNLKIILHTRGEM